MCVCARICRHFALCRSAFLHAHKHENIYIMYHIPHTYNTASLLPSQCIIYIYIYIYIHTHIMYNEYACRVSTSFAGLAGSPTFWVQNPPQT